MLGNLLGTFYPAKSTLSPGLFDFKDNRYLYGPQVIETLFNGHLTFDKVKKSIKKENLLKKHLQNHGKNYSVSEEFLGDLRFFRSSQAERDDQKVFLLISSHFEFRLKVLVDCFELLVLKNSPSRLSFFSYSLRPLSPQKIHPLPPSPGLAVLRRRIPLSTDRSPFTGHYKPQGVKCGSNQTQPLPFWGDKANHPMVGCGLFFGLRLKVGVH